MSTATVDEFLTKIKRLPKRDRDELLRRLNESRSLEGRDSPARSNGKKGYVHPNTVWINENEHKYPGKYLALKDGELIAVGNTIKEAELAANAQGVSDPLLHYVLAVGEEAYMGGWC